MKRCYYLDIDMDFFVEPIQKAAVDNIRVYKAEDCKTLPVAPLVKDLVNAGLSWSDKTLHCFTNHKKAYTYWWMDKKKGCTVIHVDAHSDLYRNSMKDLRLLPNSDIGCYNYLWYAVRDGYIDEIYWVIPDSIADIIDSQRAAEIVSNELITSVRKDEAGLHISFGCIDINGVEKEILLHVCQSLRLPYFDAECSRVTIATSPEFIPEKSDELVYELLESFGADKTLQHNIYRQHKTMLQKTAEEVREARQRLGLK